MCALGALVRKARETRGMGRDLRHGERWETERAISGTEKMGAWRVKGDTEIQGTWNETGAQREGCYKDRLEILDNERGWLLEIVRHRKKCEAESEMGAQKEMTAWR